MKKLSLGLLSLITIFSLVGCNNSDENETLLKVGATAVPHAEILEQAKPILEEKGIKLEITIFQDYVMPNTSVEEGTVIKVTLKQTLTEGH